MNDTSIPHHRDQEIKPAGLLLLRRTCRCCSFGDPRRWCFRLYKECRSFGAQGTVALGVSYHEHVGSRSGRCLLSSCRYCSFEDPTDTSFPAIWAMLRFRSPGKSCLGCFYREHVDSTASRTHGRPRLWKSMNEVDVGVLQERLVVESQVFVQTG